MPYGELYHTFNEKVEALKSQHDLHAVVIWECEFASLTKSDRKVISFLSAHTKYEHVDTGRTLFKFYNTVQSRRKKCLIGHPQIIFDKYDSLDKYFRFVKCNVLSPRGLHHPELPLRCHDKVMFSLYRTSARELRQRRRKNTAVSFDNLQH